VLRAVGPALLLAALPGTASATALTGLSTSVGLAGSLLALLASQRGSSANAATMLGLSVATLLVVVGVLRWRAHGVRFLPPVVRRRVATPRPLLARATRSDDEHALLRGAREQFLHLQSAWDAADLEALRGLTTEDMFAELAAQLPARGRGPNRTEVLALEAHLIALETIGPLELASIEFSGVVRESVRTGPAPFREVWMLARRTPGEAWRLARQQALL
jgi:hypothetical protein